MLTDCDSPVHVHPNEALAASGRLLRLAQEPVMVDLERNDRGTGGITVQEVQSARRVAGLGVGRCQRGAEHERRKELHIE